MARNEEKQLARLNRVFLQKQREEDLKKRPPRPKLETLTTPGELRKWLPTITRDIEFYVKQMEVPCYRDQQIEEFNRRISHLRGEHKAFVRKLRELDPNDVVTPWSNRPYTVKKCKVSVQSDSTASNDQESDVNNSDVTCSQTTTTQTPAKFAPLQTPVLDNDEEAILNFGYEKPGVADCPDLSAEAMNQPLSFTSVAHSTSPKRSKRFPIRFSNEVYNINMNKPRTETKPSEKPGSPNPKTGYSDNECVVPCGFTTKKLLNIPYTDSSSSGDET